MRSADIHICAATDVADMGEGKCVRVLVGKPGRKRPLGRNGSGWDDNTGWPKSYLAEFKQ